MIDSDIEKYQFVYRKGYYFDKKRGIKHKIPDIHKIFPEIKKYKNEAKRICQKK